MADATRITSTDRAIAAPVFHRLTRTHLDASICMTAYAKGAMRVFRRRRFHLLYPVLALLVCVFPTSERGLAADEMRPNVLPGGTIMLPAGFTIDVFATGVGNPRFMGMRPSDGLMFVADLGGRVYLVPPNGVPQLFADGLNLPSSVAFWRDYVYVGETNQIVRYRAANNARVPDGPKEIVVPNLPSGGYHWTRTVAFGPDGRLYVSIGSSCEECEEAETMRGTIWVYDPDGANGRQYASGIRNPVGMAWQPGNNQLWAAGPENDNIGTQEDTVLRIVDGGYYGWPYCYNGQNVNPKYNDPSKCANVPPDPHLVRIHSTPLGIAFGQEFAAPREYRDSLYIAQHGGYDGIAGYNVVRLPILPNGDLGPPQDFAFGWLTTVSAAWGRPVGVAFGYGGAMFVTDDTKGIIYRITTDG